MNKSQVLEELREVVDLTPRQAPAPKVMVADKTFAIRPAGRGRSIDMAPPGVAAMLKQAHISQDLAKRVAPETVAKLATESLKECSLLLKGGEVVDVADPHEYKLIPAPRVLDAVDRAIPDVDFSRILTLPHHTVRLELLGIEEQAVQRNDIVRAGAMVQFSPLGITQPLIQSFAVRLVCTNGVTSTEVMQQFDFGGEGNMWRWMTANIGKAYRAFPSMVQNWQRLAAEVVPEGHRASMVEGLLRQARIRGQDAEAVQALALDNPPETAWDVMNLVTYATSHILREPAHIVAAGDAAANYAGQERHADQCPICHRGMN